MTFREPDPLRECRPGGSCPDCNPKPVYCQRCLERTVEDVDDLCDECAAERDHRECECSEGDPNDLDFDCPCCKAPAGEPCRHDRRKP